MVSTHATVDRLHSVFILLDVDGGSCGSASLLKPGEEGAQTGDGDEELESS